MLNIFNLNLVWPKNLKKKPENYMIDISVCVLNSNVTLL